MVKRTVKTALLAAADGQSPGAVSAITNTEGAPSAGSVAPVAGPDPSEGAPSSTNVEASASGVQTAESGKVADAGVTVAAPATDPATEIPGDLPSAHGEVQTAEPEPKPVEGGASSSSAEASIATAQATETGETAGEGETDAPPAIDLLDDKIAEAFAAQAGLDEKTIEAIKTQILGLPGVERRRFLAYKSVRHDNVRTARGGWLTLTRSAHASLAARHLVSEDWDAGLVEET